jgi:hypothetical protein
MFNELLLKESLGKVEAQVYAQAIGIPPSQIDWGE